MNLELDRRAAMEIMGWAISTCLFPKNPELPYVAEWGGELVVVRANKLIVKWSPSSSHTDMVEVEARIGELDKQKTYLECLMEMLGEPRSKSYYWTIGVHITWKLLCATPEQKLTAALEAIKR